MHALLVLIAQVGDASTAPSTLDSAKTLAEAVQAAVTTIALVVGGIWAYFRFVKERTYRPRLEVGMHGEWRRVGRQRLLSARVTVKNIGTSVVELAQKGTGLRVSRMSSITAPPSRVSWERIRVFSIFEEHKWIEPGETISDDLLLHISVSDGEPVLFETRLVWTWRGSEGNIVVFAREIIGEEGTIGATLSAGGG